MSVSVVGGKYNDMLITTARKLVINDLQQTRDRQLLQKLYNCNEIRPKQKHHRS